MSHPEQRAFFQALADANRALLGKSRVLEIGSYDVNGNIRDIVAAKEHVGCDLSPGPGVDVVGYGHELSFAAGDFDVVLSGECFEHDQHWRSTFQNMVRMTRPGGLVAFTCASRGRLEHGTRRSETSNSPGTQTVGLDYYRNLTEHDFRGYPFGRDFSAHRFWRQRRAFDLYFAGVRSGRAAGDSFRIPTDASVRQETALTEPRDWVPRLPLRPLSFLPEGLYQPVALRYWPRAQRMTGTLLDG